MQLTLFSSMRAGALEAVDGSNLIILNSTFSNNVGLNAGAVALRNSSIFVNGSTFSYNKGPQVSDPLAVINVKNSYQSQQIMRV